MSGEMTSLSPSILSLLSDAPASYALHRFWPGTFFYSGPGGSQGTERMSFVLERTSFPSLNTAEWERQWEQREIALTWQASSLLQLRDLRFTAEAAVLEYEALPQKLLPQEQSLTVFLRSCPDNRLQEDEAVDALRQLVQALIPVHQQGMVHRFLHPLFVYPEPTSFPLQLKLSHAGLSFLSPDPLAIELPEGHSLLDFMAPELLEDPGIADHPRLDVYALGALLWLMVFGELPPPIEEIRELLSEEQLVFRDIALSQRTLGLMRHLLAENPEDRPRDARAALKAVDSPEATPPPPRPARVLNSRPPGTRSYRNITPLAFAPTEEARRDDQEKMLHKLFDTFPEFTSQMQEQLLETVEADMAATQEAQAPLFPWEDEIHETLQDNEIPFAQEFGDAYLMDSASSEALPDAILSAVLDEPRDVPIATTRTPFVITSETILPESIPEDWEQEALAQDAEIYTQPRKRLASLTKLWLLLGVVSVLLAGMVWMCHSGHP
jgi:serine/threonine protein kinase